MSILKNKDGFTLVEICVAIGLTSILALAIGEMTFLSAKATQSSKAEEEFNEEIGLVVNLLNATSPTSGGQSPCTKAFAGMPITFPLPYPIPTSIDFTYGSGNSIIKVNSPINDLKINYITFTAILDQGFSATSPYLGATIYLLNLEIQGQQLPGFGSITQLGGIRTFTKDIVVPLWITTGPPSFINGCVG